MVIIIVVIISSLLPLRRDSRLASHPPIESLSALPGEEGRVQADQTVTAGETYTTLCLHALRCDRIIPYYGCSRFAQMSSKLMASVILKVALTKCCNNEAWKRKSKTKPEFEPR